MIAPNGYHMGRQTGNILLVVYGMLFCCSGFCQNPGFRFENITSENGMADRMINAVVQDSRGFIWVGSEEGLTKYNGYTSVVYRHELNNPYSLADNEIMALCTGKDGALWIGTRNGLSRYNAMYDRFENFYHDSTDVHSIAGNEIIALANDASGNIWIGTYGAGLDLLEKKTIDSNTQYRFKHYRHSDKDSFSISSDQVFSVCADTYNNIWAGTAKGLNLWDRATHRFTRFYKNEQDSNAISHNIISKIYAGNDGYIWLCGKGMLDKVKATGIGRRASIRVQHILPFITGNTDAGDWAINSFLIDRAKNMWVATNDQGLMKFRTGTAGKPEPAEAFISNPLSSYSLVNPLVFSLYEDRSGVTWIGTSKGLSKYIPSKNRFYESNAIKHATNPNGQSIMALLHDAQNRLWIGYDFDTISVLTKRDDNVEVARIKLPFADGESDQVNTMFQSTAGPVYIGTLTHGVYMLVNAANLDQPANWITINKDNCPGLPSNNIYSITEDRYGAIWFGTYKGVCRYTAGTGKADSRYASPLDNVRSDFIMRSLYVDEQNIIWCGTDDGLYLLKNGRLFKAFQSCEQDTGCLTNNRVTVIFADSHKRLWIGTKNGLNLYRPATGNFRQYTTLGAVSLEGIMSILEDAKGNLWISSNHGLVQFNYTENKAQHYGIPDGLPSDEFIWNAASADSYGNFYFNTTNGLIAFKPSLIVPNNYVPPIAITDIKILDQSLSMLHDTALIHTYRREKKLVLRYSQNFFSFEFAALNYINTQANRYAYMLEGVDPQWNYSGEERVARYTDIQPGHYTFKIKASNNDGIWNNVPETIQVIIIPPWWRTWWFYSLCLISTCAIIYIIYRARVKQILKMYKLRSSIAKDLHDDVGSALSSIALLSRIAQEGKTNAKLQPAEIFSRIGDTSKRMIDLMDDIVWSVNPDNDRFSNMLIRMREYAVEMLEARNIDFTFQISAGIDELKIPMQMRKDYFLIFKEAVNNLAKYSGAGTAAITIERVKNTIITTIADNGKGFEQNILHSGNGLKNMQSRAAALRGKLLLQTAEGKGTTVILLIPAA